MRLAVQQLLAGAARRRIEPLSLLSVVLRSSRSGPGSSGVRSRSSTSRCAPAIRSVTCGAARSVWRRAACSRISAAA